jgi:hypothetical protein
VRIRRSSKKYGFAEKEMIVVGGGNNPAGDGGGDMICSPVMTTGRGIILPRRPVDRSTTT